MTIYKTFVLLVTALLTIQSAAQNATDFAVPRTEWDQPDLQGVWNFSSDIPMERPEEFGTQQFLTPLQLEERRARIEAERAAADARAARLVINPDAPPVADRPGGYNDFWVESAGIGDDLVRTSHLIHPENGRTPPAVEGAKFQRGGGAGGPDIPGARPVRYVVGGIAKDGPEDRGLSERCIVGFNAGPPFRPSLYNNNLQIFQNRDTVVILTEMINDARIVPLGDKPHVDDDIRFWSGDSRGYWDGDSLVVETRNFNGLRQSWGSYGDNYNALLTERFTRGAYDRVDYQFTVDDPSSYTDRITGIVPMTKVAGQLYEYACHEGNYGMTNILRGERMAELRAEEAESGSN
jgi:hypothetical protein